MKGKPVLVKSKKDNCSGKRKFKSLFVEFEKGHANTNVILQRAFTDGDMFADQTPVRKYHKGRPVDA